MKTTMIMRILAMMSYLEVLHRQMTVKKLVLQMMKLKTLQNGKSPFLQHCPSGVPV